MRGKGGNGTKRDQATPLRVAKGSPHSAGCRHLEESSGTTRLQELTFPGADRARTPHAVTAPIGRAISHRVQPKR